MTVIGEAYIAIKGQVEGDLKNLSGVEGDIEGVGTTAEKTSGRAKRAFSAIGGALSNAFGPAFAPMQEVVDSFSNIDKQAGGLKKNIGTYAIGIGGAMTAAGTMITTASDKDKVSTKQLEQAVVNAGGSWDKYKDKTEETIHTQEGFGHTAVETQDALTDLVTRTHNVSGSYENMQLVADLAAQKHISLASAASLVSRVMNGQTRTLKLYGISQDALNKAMDKGHYHEVSQKYDLLQSSIAADKSKSATLSLRDAKIRDQLSTTTNKAEQAKLNAELKRDTLTRAELSHRISDNTAKSKDLKTQMTDMQKGAAAGRAGIELLSQKLHGQAAIAADTFSGKMAMVKAKIEDFIGTVGQKVGPALQVMGPAMMGFGAIVETGIVGKLGKAAKAAVAFMKPAQLAATATKVWTAIQAAFNVVMDANPIILVSAAVIALGAAVYLAYTHFKPFRDIVNDIGRFLKDVFVSAFDAVKKALTAFVHGIEAAFDWLVNAMKKYGTIILAVVAPFIGLPLLIIQHWNTIKDFFLKLLGDIVGFFQKLPGRIVTAIGNIGSAVWGGIKGGFSALKSHLGDWISSAVTFFGGMAGKVVHGIGNLGKKIWDGVTSGLDWLKGKFKWIIDAMVYTYIQLPIRAIRGIGNIGSKIWSAINDGLATLKSHISDWISSAVNFFQRFPAQVMRAIGNIGSDIWGGIKSGMSNMKDHITSWISSVVSWFKTLPGKVVSGIGNLGNAIWNGIRGGLSDIGGKIKNALSGIAGKVKDAFSDAGSWLVSAGGKIIGGLTSGIISAVGSGLKSAVTGIAHKIASWKGPRDYDAKLLKPAGDVIMQGLITGIEGRMPHLQRTMKGVGNQIKLPMYGNSVGIPVNGAGQIGGGNTFNLFPNAIIDFGNEHPAQVVRRLEAALRASRL